MLGIILCQAWLNFILCQWHRARSHCIVTLSQVMYIEKAKDHLCHLQIKKLGEIKIRLFWPVQIFLLHFSALFSNLI